ncbi:MAG: penicillin acylase family protein [Bacteroidetes bacterium]|nr:penicillin acylase family protein [Bacteroidota bacterium]
MRIFFFILTAAVTVTLVYFLNISLKIGGAQAPAFGKFLSPQHGFWQNAEADDADFSADLHFPQLSGKVEVYLDKRLVPHVFAENENDVYFVQGYLHAKFRLWQMELQTLAAAGRASEIVGDIALNHDREFRRLGMVYGAENSLKQMEANETVKNECDAYTAGVNAYIDQLPDCKLPIEYKLLGYKPEHWSNLKTALFLKYMSYDLAAHENDFEMTNAQAFFNPADFKLLFPSIQDSLDPIIPKGTAYSKPKIPLNIPATADSLYFKKDTVTAIPVSKPNKANGSNNWAVSASKTKNGAPILCNDPHLGLNLPSLWIEMQLSTPTFNAYGASFPGAPSIIIGYNDDCAFGFTNGGRDVRDYFEITFKDDTRQEYWFNNEWKKTDFRIETIKVKGKPDVLDTVAYTIFGPVMYDKSFGGKRISSQKNYAVKWTAHAESNELLMFNMLNHAHNYNDYQQAVQNLHTPGQNCIFACKNGDIAIRTQGEFPAKWNGQGDFIMPGTDSSYMWQYMIPMDETPFQYNPERGFVSSANQRPADSAYPYYLGRDYPSPRGFYINRKLASMNNITPQDMEDLQTNNYNVFGEMAAPVLIKNINIQALNADEKSFYDLLKDWNFYNEKDSKAATVFVVTWQHFLDTVYADEYKNAPQPIAYPMNSTLLEAVLKDTAYKFLDDINTATKESLADMATIAFKTAVKELVIARAEGKLEWSKYKDTHVNHLLKKIAPFNREHLDIGGGTNVINATTSDHGPSWRMVVSLTEKTEAYGVYPGGQSGNPGSKYYDNFINDWVQGKYYTLWMMTKSETRDPKVKWKMTFSKG